MNISKSDFDFQPVLRNSLLELRPIESNDFNNLYVAASDPMIWEQHPFPHRYQKESFREYFASALGCKSALVVWSEEDRQLIGCSRYYNFDQAQSYVMIGYTFLNRDYWGGKINFAMKKLMLNHAFQFVNEVQFEIDSKNIRSQKAIEKIGASFLRSYEKTQPGQNPRTVLIYSILKSKWG